MGIRMKLGLSYLAMILMIVVLGIFALWSMSNMQKSADDAAVSALKYRKGLSPFLSDKEFPIFLTNKIFNFALCKKIMHFCKNFHYMG